MRPSNSTKDMEVSSLKKKFKDKKFASSTCFNSILYNDPMPIDEFKPYLYNTIRTMLKGDSI